MKRLSNLYQQIYDFENLYEAYRQARKCKRYRREVLDFTRNLEQNLIEIQNELIWQTYQVGRYREFFVHDPKKRLIMALPFKDRVVQWAIYRVLNPLLDKRYLNTSYACRVGYGTHKAVARVQYWLRRLSRQCGQVYVLKMDIAKYFYRIDHDVLMAILSRILADRELLRLLETIIRSETHFGLSISDHGFTGNRISGIGMPIGNLTSQMFANLYLNELDQYAKHQLRIKQYVRYMDDILVLHHDKQVLWQHKDAIDRFLKERLTLSLNNKTCVRTISQGVEFCGYRIWPTKMRMKRKSKVKMLRRLTGLVRKMKAGGITYAEYNTSLQSYLGTVKHCSGDGLKQRLIAIAKEATPCQQS